MGKLAKGATTPQSISELSAKVGQTVNDAEASANNKQCKSSDLGIQDNLCQFFRVMKIRQSDNPDYLLVTLIEGDRRNNPVGITTPYHIERLGNQYYGKTFLKPGMTRQDADPETFVTLHHLVHKLELVDLDYIEEDFYMYDAQIEIITVEEQPSENHYVWDVVDDNGKVVESNVYKKKRFVRMDGTPMKSVE